MKREANDGAAEQPDAADERGTSVGRSPLIWVLDGHDVDPEVRTEGRPMKLRNKKRRPEVGVASWMEEDGLHLMMPGTAPGVADLAELTRRYQEKVRQSPLWEEMIQRFGKDGAERLLREFRREEMKEPSSELWTNGTNRSRTYGTITRYDDGVTADRD